MEKLHTALNYQSQPPQTCVLSFQAVHLCEMYLWSCFAPQSSLWWQYWLQYWETHTHLSCPHRDPGNRHKKTSNSCFFLATNGYTDYYEGDGSCLHMKTKSSNYTVRPDLLVKLSRSCRLKEIKRADNLCKMCAVQWNSALLWLSLWVMVIFQGRLLETVWTVHRTNHKATN